MKRLSLNGLHGALGALLMLTLSACAMLDARPPVLGQIADGIYTQPQGNFFCPLQVPRLGLVGNPRITDAVVLSRTEHIPLSQREPGDWRNNRVIYEGTKPARSVTFEYPSGAVVEIGSGRRMHPVEQVLSSRMSGGVSWRFERREIEYATGRMMLGLLLVPWHQEAVVYMGLSPAEAWKQGQGPDAELWIPANIVVNDTHHHVTVRLPAAPLLSARVGERDLPGIRDDIQEREDLREQLLVATGDWLARCTFPEEIR